MCLTRNLSRQWGRQRTLHQRCFHGRNTMARWRMSGPVASRELLRTSFQQIDLPGACPHKSFLKLDALLTHDLCSVQLITITPVFFVQSRCDLLSNRNGSAGTRPQDSCLQAVCDVGGCLPLRGSFGPPQLPQDNPGMHNDAKSQIFEPAAASICL